MAIYSLNHKAIGKATQEQPHTAAAHIRYVTRAKACSQVLAERMPAGAGEAQAWLRREEDGDRKNGRVVDKLMLALPRELSPAQRVALVRDFAERVTRGKAAWLAAFHDQGKDERNPHCHLVIRDRDAATGKRVAKLSEKGSTQLLRELWETAANAALEAAGRAERIDRRTLKAQGIDRPPTIHEGVRARRVHGRGRRPVSRAVNQRNAALARSRSRMVNYPLLDSGRTRIERNRQLAREREGEREFWDAVDADRVVREWESEDRRRKWLRLMRGGPDRGKGRER